MAAPCVVYVWAKGWPKSERYEPVLVGTTRTYRRAKRLEKTLRAHGWTTGITEAWNWPLTSGGSR